MPCKNGFSIIELVVVLVLLGIVSVVMIPRFLTPSAVNDTAARDALVATIRSAQQAALGRSNVSFEITPGPATTVFTASAGLSTVIRTLEVPSRNLKLETGSPQGGSADTCAAGSDFNTAVASGFRFTFDPKGNLKTFTNPGLAGAPFTVDDPPGFDFNGVRICVNDSVELSVCVSPAGYAHVGNCDA